MPKIDKIKELHLKYRKERKSDEVAYLSTVISEIERNVIGKKNDRTLDDIEKGVLKEYYNSLIKTGSPNSRKEMKFLREEGIIDNMMNIQEIDLNLNSIYTKRVKEDPSFAKNPSRHKEVLVEFVKSFVPTVAEFESVKQRQIKVFNL